MIMAQSSNIAADREEYVIAIVFRSLLGISHCPDFIPSTFFMYQSSLLFTVILFLTFTNFISFALHMISRLGKIDYFMAICAFM